MMIGTRLLARMRAADFHAVELGQHQVEDDEIGLFEGLLQTREAVVGGLDLVAFVFEFEAQHSRDLRVVLDDEDVKFLG